MTKHPENPMSASKDRKIVEMHAEIERLRGLLCEALDMAGNWPGIAYSADLKARCREALPGWEPEHGWGLPANPTPAEPALWAPEGLEAHLRDGFPDCQKCCLSRTDQCETTPCAAAGHGLAHPSGRNVYFTRKP